MVKSFFKLIFAVWLVNWLAGQTGNFWRKAFLLLALPLLFVAAARGNADSLFRPFYGLLDQGDPKLIFMLLWIVILVGLFAWWGVSARNKA